MKKSFFAVLLLSLMIFLFSAPASALWTGSHATAKAEFDWSAMTITGAGVITWSSQSTYTDALATNILGVPDYVSNGGADWGNYFSTATVLPDATATGSAGADGVPGSKLTSTANAGPPGLLVPYSEARAERYGVFSVAAGMVAVSIPYTLSYDLTAAAGPPDDSWAYGFSNIWIGLSRTNPNPLLKPTSAGTVVYISDLATNGMNLAQTKTGTASLNLDFKAGDTGYVTFGTYAGANASAVPIPGAIWLLGTGLLGVVGIRRRRKLS